MESATKYTYRHYFRFPVYSMLRTLVRGWRKMGSKRFLYLSLVMVILLSGVFVPLAHQAVSATAPMTPANVTPSGPPSVVTRDPLDPTATATDLYGVLTDMGTAATVDVSFEWGTDTSYGNTTTPQPRPATVLDIMAEDLTIGCRAG
jgi:hypothetical protein